MARSGSSDLVAINCQGEEATWQLVERPIKRGFKAVDLHLSEGGYVARSDSSDCVLISAIDQEEL